MNKKPNHLQDETSPYLLQHAHNPVDWYPWGTEALEKAKTENKPLLVSIGYSACHWCHVMEAESFENTDVARVQNELFINIKIDREERPDLDEIYMNAVQALTGRGGWPLHVFLTPDLKPFFGGTYFPPQDRYGIPSWLTVLKRVSDFYHDSKEELAHTERELFLHLQKMNTAAGSGDANLSPEPIIRCVEQLKKSFDLTWGGFGPPPKFPHVLDIQLLLQRHRKNHDEAALSTAVITLERMARGGMYDQLAGGFHRYSTDEKWLIPHFEKMLYDNALLMNAYVDGYLATKNPYFKNIVLEIATYIQREMTHACGAFYAAQDADSEGEEGRYFVWTPAQIEVVLGMADARIFCAYFDVTPQGNFESGASVLWIPEALDSVAARLGLSSETVLKTVTAGRDQLREARQKRVAPQTDKKIILSWNALMVGALARASHHLKLKELYDQARRAADFIFEHMVKEGIFYHTHTMGMSTEGQGHVKIPGFLDDYAYLTRALLELFQASGDNIWKDRAIFLQEKTHEEFSDEDSVGFYYTRKNQDDVIVRSQNRHDGSTPSAQAVAALNLLHLGKILGRDDFLDRCSKILRRGMPFMLQAPRACVQLISCLDEFLDGATPQCGEDGCVIR